MEVNHIELESIDSTQSFARKKVSSFDPKALTVISALEQTRGRGRLDRTWISPKGEALAITYAFRLPHSEHSSNTITLVLALSIAEVLQKLGVRSQIKWPNDIYINEKKVGGILAEVETEKADKQVYLGFGLNVNIPPEKIANYPFSSTSLLFETHRTWAMDTLSQSIKTTFIRDLSLFIKEGFKPFQQAFEELSFFHGKTVRLDIGSEVIRGKYVRVDPDGGLVLELEKGEKKPFLSGEVIDWE